MSGIYSDTVIFPVNFAMFFARSLAVNSRQKCVMHYSNHCILYFIDRPNPPDDMT